MIHEILSVTVVAAITSMAAYRLHVESDAKDYYPFMSMLTCLITAVFPPVSLALAYWA